MADIAMLVAEEYERRMRASEKAASTTTTTTTLSVGGGVAPALAEKLRGVSWVKKPEAIFRSLEPSSQMGVAALSGFFSA